MIPPDADLYLTESELEGRLSELDTPNTAAEYLERRALRELRERRGDLQSGLVPVSRIAHEIRNALVPAQICLEILIKDASDPATRAEKALVGVARILAWVDNLVRRGNS